MQDSAISVLAEAMLTHRRTGFIVFRPLDEQCVIRATTGFDVDTAMPGETPADAELAAVSLLQRGCDLIVLWQTAMSLQEFTEPGELVMPTRVIDAESGERRDTALVRMGRRDRAALLSAGVIADPGARRRLAMRFQCVVMDTCAATLSRLLERSDVPFFVVCAQIDSRADRWTNRILAWRLRFSPGNPLRHLGWLLFKPREIQASLNSRSEARIALRDTATLLRDVLEEFLEERGLDGGHAESAAMDAGVSGPGAIKADAAVPVPRRRLN